MGKLLLVDACVSTHDSRTKQIAEAYIEEFTRECADIEVVRREVRKGTVDSLTPENLSLRDDFIKEDDFSHDIFALAREIKEADHVVFAAPFWDLSFPAILKVYIENIMVVNLTFSVNGDGFFGLCKAKNSAYITSAGGSIGQCNFGYDYIKGISNMIGLGDVSFVSAERLDIVGENPELILEEAKSKAREEARKVAKQFSK